MGISEKNNGSSPLASSEEIYSFTISAVQLESETAALSITDQGQDLGLNFQGSSLSYWEKRCSDSLLDTVLPAADSKLTIPARSAKT